MLNRVAGASCADVRVESEHLLPIIGNCYRSAVKKLAQSYEDGRPAAILISESRFGLDHVIGRFLEGVDEDTVIIRIDSSCADSTAFMQEVVRSVGFKPDDLSLGDLEKVLELFLQYQRSHKLKTMIVVQEADMHGWWVMDKLRRLVELEMKEKFGLKVILAGPPGVITVLNEPVLDVIISAAIDRIVLTPFTLAETRKFIRRQIEQNGESDYEVEDVSQVFEFFAVNLIHDICSGVPEDVYQLSSRCLELHDQHAERPISVDDVKQAAAYLGLTPLHADERLDSEPALVESEIAPLGRLVIQSPGEQPSEITLDQSCFVIGRSALCNIVVHGPKVSRFHAMLSMSDVGLQIADLGSTNGTAVNGEAAKRRALRDSDVITIGSTRITYVAGGEQLTLNPDIESTDEYEIPEQEPEPCITYLGEDIRLIQTS
jgi:type II secretory pathway predicted ATPase ExeA